jgi:DNA-binding Lrp family transcriptional regulator
MEVKKMVKAFILVDADVNRISDVSNELNKIDLEVYPLFGEHDFIVISEFEDSKTTASNLIEKIHPIEGVIKTETLVGSEIINENEFHDKIEVDIVND